MRGKRWAKAAGILCSDSMFWLYLDRRARTRFGNDVPDGTHIERDAADWVRRACNVTTRSDIDRNPAAVKMLVGIRSRFEHWKKKQGGRRD